jgi:hypothetical protein
MSKAEEFIEIEKCKRGRVEPPEWGGVSQERVLEK